MSRRCDPEKRQFPWARYVEESVQTLDMSLLETQFHCLYTHQSYAFLQEPIDCLLAERYNHWMPDMSHTSGIKCVWCGIYSNRVCLVGWGHWTPGNIINPAVHLWKYCLGKTLCNFDRSRPKQNCRHFADDSFKCIFMTGNVWTLLVISLKFVP